MKTKSFQRWYRISLFKALVVFTLLCIGLAIFGQIRSRAMKQEEAVLKFLSRQTLGDAYVLNIYPLRAPTLLYDFEAHPNDLRPAIEVAQPEPSWLAGWLGLDMVHNVEVVRFRWSEPRIEDVGLLKDFPGLKIVTFDRGITEPATWDELMRNRSIEKIEFCNASNPQPSSPIEFIGLSKLTRLNELKIVDGDLTAENIRQIANCKNLQTLRLMDVQIKRDDLLNFPSMGAIKAFYWSIGKNSVDDIEFRFIESFPYLEKCAMSGRWEISDQVFTSLEKLRNLTDLSLHGANLTGSELSRLSQLRLTKLELGASNLNDAGLAFMGDFKRLTYLEIGSTDVTDAGMQHIAKLTRLRHLSIRDTVVGDAGLQAIVSLPDLRFLRIRDTKITDEGIAQFRKLHPSCSIDRN